MLARISWKNQEEKVWLLLFVCVTRAVHLETVSALSVKKFLLVYWRFVTRIGQAHTYTSSATLKLSLPEA